MAYRGQDYDDRDDPQPEDIEDLERNGDFDPCPECGRAVYEGVPKCPYCGHWLLDDDSEAAKRASGWLWPVMVALLLAVILVMWHGLGR